MCECVHWDVCRHVHVGTSGLSQEEHEMPVQMSTHMYIRRSCITNQIVDPSRNCQMSEQCLPPPVSGNTQGLRVSQGPSGNCPNATRACPNRVPCNEYKCQQGPFSPCTITCTRGCPGEVTDQISTATCQRCQLHVNPPVCVQVGAQECQQAGITCTTQRRACNLQPCTQPRCQASPWGSCQFNAGNTPCQTCQSRQHESLE